MLIYWSYYEIIKSNSCSFINLQYHEIQFTSWTSALITVSLWIWCEVYNIHEFHRSVKVDMSIELQYDLYTKGILITLISFTHVHSAQREKVQFLDRNLEGAKR